MPVLSRGEVLSTNKRRFLRAPVGDFGEVRVRSLSQLEQREIKSKLQKADGSLDMERFKYAPELLLCATLVDEEGNPLFTTDDAFGGAFNEVDSRFVAGAFRIAQRWTGFLDDEGFDDIEAAIKNSKAGRSNGSPA